MHPKQFIGFFNGHGKSLLATTLARLAGQEPFAAPLIVCNEEHRFLVRDEVQRAGIEPQAIVLEPIARNTAPAIAVAALLATRSDPDAILIVMPSDHAIADADGFIDSILKAAAIAEEGRLVLFGIQPTEPHVGYGYIRRGEPLKGKGAGFEVAAFCEKPDRTRAEAYLAAGDYFWNSGIFVLHARTFLKELERFAPAIRDAAQAALQKATPDLEFLRLDKAAFAASPQISVDYAIIEKTDAAAMVPVDVGWSDVGSWASLWKIAPHRDGAGNAVVGESVLIDTRDCLVHSEKALVATIGVDNLVIVDTPDALLVADKSRSEEVSEIVAKLKKSNRTEHLQHLRNHRPWGYFETLSVGSRFQVKVLHVKPGGKLSLQMHHHRSEHWVVVRGTARVIVGEEEKLVQENESVYITATHWHRLENPGKVALEIIEVQIGTYLGEDDIVRSEDIYRRAPEETR
jgi:mannose-1-phosphate guanylyltransferase/mannose-6-phosphate isomerase